MSDKKTYERNYFELLSAKVALPEGNVGFGDAPDVRVNGVTDCLGVEVTRLFKQSDANSPSPRQEEAEQHLIVQAAKTIVERSGQAPLMVSVHFGAYPLLRKSDRDTLSQQIADLVISHAPTVDAFLPLNNDFSNFERFPEKIAAIHILRNSQMTEHHWQNGRGGWVDSDFVTDLQSSIDDKNGKHAAYLNECDRCWLIVAADWEGGSSFFQFTDEMSQHVFSSEFERSFFIDGFTKEVYELRTHPQTKVG